MELGEDFQQLGFINVTEKEIKGDSDEPEGDPSPFLGERLTRILKEKIRIKRPPVIVFRRNPGI